MSCRPNGNVTKGTRSPHGLEATRRAHRVPSGEQLYVTPERKRLSLEINGRPVRRAPIRSTSSVDVPWRGDGGVVADCCRVTTCHIYSLWVSERSMRSNFQWFSFCWLRERTIYQPATASSRTVRQHCSPILFVSIRESCGGTQPCSCRRVLGCPKKKTVHTILLRVRTTRQLLVYCIKYIVGT